jgi:multiple sugar transport system permease protein
MKGSKWGYFYLLPAFLSCLFVLVYPLFYNLQMGFREVTFVTFIRGGSPWVGLGNYWSILHNPVFLRVLSNTAIFWLGSISVQFVLGFLLALLFNKNFPLNYFYRALILLPWFIPLTVSGTVFKWFFSGETGLINSLLLGMGLINKPIPWLTSPRLAIYTATLANIWLGIPFNFIMLFTGLQAIPVELYESAKVEGAHEWQLVRYVTVPLLKPTILLTLILGSIFTIKVFDVVWVLTGGGPGDASHIFTTWAYSLAWQRFRFGEHASVIGIMMLFISLLGCLLLFARRHWRVE